MLRRFPRAATGTAIFATRPARAARLALAILFLGAGGWVSSALAQISVANEDASAVDTARYYDIPAGPLPAVLTRFSAEADIYLAGLTRIAEGKHSPGLKGNYRVQDALSALLAGTDIEAVPDGSAQYVLRPVLKPGQQANESVLAEATLAEINVIATAEEELKQSPGVSLITAQDLEKRPPANDLAEIIRTMPGVNLTGSGSSGAFGNNRQIDLRGMGPENTLIMVDGKPVNSRQSVRMGRNGERNSRGDTNWVPAEAIESIEVIRGPAAARYGSGSMGGVVNIITKRPEKTLSGSLQFYLLTPEDEDESYTRRASFHVAGPLSDKLSFRLYGNAAKTTPDDPNINATPDTANTVPPAGREGVRNRDINALLRWDIASGHVLDIETGFSRQGNIFAGENPSGTMASEVQKLIGSEETNIMYRRTASFNWRGDYGGGKTSKVILSYEGTSNRRLREEMSSGGENQGSISQGMGWSESKLDNYRLASEFNTPLSLGGIRQILTVGAEYAHFKLDDPYSMSACPGGVCDARVKRTDPEATQTLYSLFIEDNVEILQDLLLIPGVRLDHHNEFGANWSPYLNAHYMLTPTITIKAGIARAFKAPNLYQLNPNYFGGGCPKNLNLASGCGVFGNADLDPEISVNKEVGLAWVDGNWGAGLTFFQNDYSSKIVTDIGTSYAAGEWYQLPTGQYAFHWDNAGKAVVRGLEGHLNIPILQTAGKPRLMWRNNLTYMDKNHSKETGQPLSMVPKYTVNSQLEWNPMEELSFLLTATFYGKQKPRTYNTFTNVPVTDSEALRPRDPYHILGLSVGYFPARNTRIQVGINNLLDKRLQRLSSSSSKGANNYNEPGRAYYVTLSLSF